MKICGLIASDIDNTLTDKHLIIPEKVCGILSRLHSEGWQMIFLTGRSFTFAYYSVGKLTFPYFVGVQNGAELIQMPEGKVLSQCFLSKEVLMDLDEIYQDEKEDFIIYAGYERGDFGYYRPKRFSPKFREYLEKIQRLHGKESWIEIEDFSKVQSTFPLIRCIGARDDMERVKEKLLRKRELNVILMGDVVEPSLSILLITHKDADKGKVLRELCKQQSLEHLPIITAGDSYNDIGLLQEGDVRIAMETGPPELKQLATIIAKPAEECGIIAALEVAVKRCQELRP